jgi:alpha-mannosidase
MIYKDIDLIECRMTVNWQEQMKMLKLSFPLRLESPIATYDLSYGSIERPCNGEEEPGQQWLDVSGYAIDASGTKQSYGMALLNDCKYGFDVLGADMRMSILRSPIYAYHDPYKSEPGRQYVYQDQGIQTITYRLVPHAGAWQDAAIPHKAWELNVQPTWVNEYAHAGSLALESSFLNAKPDNILISICKLAEDEDALMVRGYECAGKPTMAQLLLPTLGIEWQSEFGAHEIKSWLIRPHDNSVHEVDMIERSTSALVG